MKMVPKLKRKMLKVKMLKSMQRRRRRREGRTTTRQDSSSKDPSILHPWDHLNEIDKSKAVS